MPTKVDKDAVSGRETTGHEWDGIRELNTPMPKWWLYVFAATVVWAMGWLVLYPSIPLGRTYFHGLLGYSSRHDVMAGVQEMQAKHQDAMARIAATPITEIPKDPALMEVAMTAGRITFANNCQACHGPNGEGRVGYPALGDDVWLWGGKLTDIQQTITHGIRAGNPDTRQSEMPAFGADSILKPQEIGAVADYISTLFGLPAAGQVEAGRKLFADNCAACHGDKGQGGRQFGAPPLAARVHLYGGDRDAIIAQVTRPRHGMMPAWGGRLDPATIKSVAIFVHALGGGE